MREYERLSGGLCLGFWILSFCVKATFERGAISCNTGQMSRVINLFSRADGGKMCQAQVYSDPGFKRRQGGDFFFDRDGHKISTGGIHRDHSFAYFSTFGQWPVKANLNLSRHLIQLNASVCDREAVTVIGRRLFVVLFLKAGIAALLFEKTSQKPSPDGANLNQRRT